MQSKKHGWDLSSVMRGNDTTASYIMIIIRVWSFALQRNANESAKFATCYFGIRLSLRGRRCVCGSTRKYRLLIFPARMRNKTLFLRATRTCGPLYLVTTKIRNVEFLCACNAPLSRWELFPRVDRTSNKLNTDSPCFYRTSLFLGGRFDAAAPFSSILPSRAPWNEISGYNRL